MISKKMLELVQNGSIIRAMFEEGKKLKEIYGADHVFDFSLGNPSVEPPLKVKEAIIDLVSKESPNYLHGYMSNAGYEDVRSMVAASINNKFQTKFTENNIIMTVGAAGGLNVILKTLLNPQDEVIVFAPYFGEYKNYVENFNGSLIVVRPKLENFQPDLVELEEKITPATKAILINTPNNPTGVVYSEETIKDLASILEKKQEEYNTSIYLISDEPYRELAYDGVEVPYLTKYYQNTIVGYSYSKSLSLPGERIGYLVIPEEVEDFQNVVAAANVANRILGFVNAPSLLQRVVGMCLDSEVDIALYDKNRELFYQSLQKFGYTCVKPEGAFYLFVKSLETDDKAFALAAKKYNILVVPGTSFGCPGYFRIAYCVSIDTIKGSLPGFEQLAKDYGVENSLE